MIKMAEKKTFDLTQEGLDQLKAELDKLRLEDRPRIIQAIKDARAQGDLSENAEYDAARDEQAKTEERIKEIEYIVENANVVKASKSKVGIGSVVTVLYVDDDEEEEYKMVGETEVDIDNNKISANSPIGKAIFGQKAGETVSVEAPNGSYELKIVSIN
jgi:transcription elongation factor GreA